MKKIIKKTEEERIAQVTETRVAIKDTKYFYFACDKCGIAFFDEDIIIKCSDGYNRCPNVVSSLFKKDSVCKNQMYGGNEETFNKYYKFE